MKLSHLVFPHPDTHQKAPLLSSKALVIYILLFVALRFGIGQAALKNPQILGISTSMSVTDLIALTNVERQKNGLSALSENSMLDQAAAAKAQNMFAENYWAHYSPSGKDPWGFINAAGYKFSYAGENLAKNFHTASEVVKAWMNSPTHKENMVNPHYTDIGMAVATGSLQGENTVLVVQEFGAPNTFVAKSPVESNIPPANAPKTADLPNTSSPNQPADVPTSQKSQVLPASLPLTQPVFDTFGLVKSLSMSLLIFISMLLVLDFVILKRRGVVRVSSHHWSHFALLAVAASSLAVTHSGEILDGLQTLIK